MSFLASWDLDRAISLDGNYVRTHFNHLIEAKKNPLKELVIFSLNDNQYLDLISDIIKDGEVRFHVIQVITKLINGNNEKEKESGIQFVTKCLSSNNKELIELAMDLFEFSSIKEIFIDKWNIAFTEKLYKSLARISEHSSPSFRKASLMTINKLRQQVPSLIGLAARNEFDRMESIDKQYILDRVTNSYRFKKINSYPKITIHEHDAWDTIDYAHDLIIKYRNCYSEEFPNIFKLADSLGILVDISTMNTEQFDACLLRDASLPMPIIFVNNARKSEGRINFSIAHEIAHAILPKHQSENFFCYVDDISESNRIKMDKWKEREANEFASYILLPDKEYKSLTQKMDFNSENLYRISSSLGVSLTFAAFKWVKLSNLQIGVVLSKDSIVEWGCLSEKFPYTYGDMIKSIDQTSSACLVLNNNRTRYKQVVNSSSWFEEDYAKYTISEESIKIFDNQVLTLLQVVDER
jgi:Zn-dependent peptidase ImmA (M78 family)